MKQNKYPPDKRLNYSFGGFFDLDVYSISVTTCKSFFSFIFALCCLMFFLLLKDVVEADNFLDQIKISNSIYSWKLLLKVLTISITVVFPFLMVFVRLTHPGTTILFPNAPVKFLMSSCRLVVCTLLSILAVASVQFVLWAIHNMSQTSEPLIAITSQRGGFLSLILLSLYDIKWLNCVLLFAVSDEGARSITLMLALPGAAMAAFVAAYATTQLAFPIVLDAWENICKLQRVFLSSLSRFHDLNTPITLSGPHTSPSAVDLGPFQQRVRLLRQLTVTLTNQKKAMLHLHIPHLKLPHPPKEVTQQNQRKPQHQLLLLQRHYPHIQSVKSHPISELHSTRYVSNTPQHIDNTQLPSEQAARKSLALLTLQQDLTQCEHWSRQLFLDMLALAQCSHDDMKHTDNPPTINSSPSTASTSGWLSRSGCVLICLAGLVRLFLAIRRVVHCVMEHASTANTPPQDLITSSYHLMLRCQQYLQYYYHNNQSHRALAEVEEIQRSQGMARSVCVVVFVLALLHLRGLALALQNLAGANMRVFRSVMGSETAMFALRLSAFAACYLLACVLLILRGQLPVCYRSRVGLFHLLHTQDTQQDTLYNVVFDVVFVCTAGVTACALALQRARGQRFVETLQRHFYPNYHAHSVGDSDGPVQSIDHNCHVPNNPGHDSNYSSHYSGEHGCGGCGWVTPSLSRDSKER